MFVFYANYKSVVYATYNSIINIFIFYMSIFLMSIALGYRWQIYGESVLAIDMIDFLGSDHWSILIKTKLNGDWNCSDNSSTLISVIRAQINNDSN